MIILRKENAIVRRLRRGMPHADIHRETGVSITAIRRVARERQADIEGPIDLHLNETDKRLREKCIEFIADLMAKGTWDGNRVSQLVKYFGVQRFEIASFAIAAAERVSRGLDPSMLSAVLEETIYELRRLAYHCERNGRPEVSVAARRAVGQMIVSLSKNNPDTAKATKQIIHLHQAQSQQAVSAKTGAEELIAQGWSPPVPYGLPPITDDETALNNDFEETENVKPEER
jgi:hypothetical protein